MLVNYLFKGQKINCKYYAKLLEKPDEKKKWLEREQNHFSWENAPLYSSATAVDKFNELN